jgi:hypothetical protein
MNQGVPSSRPPHFFSQTSTDHVAEALDDHPRWSGVRSTSFRYLRVRERHPRTPAAMTPVASRSRLVGSGTVSGVRNE